MLVALSISETDGFKSPEVNDAPVANNATASTNEDVAASGDLKPSVSDIDNATSTLTFAQIGTTLSTEGVFVLNTDGTYSFTPALNFNGTVTISYAVCDPSGLCDTASLTITVSAVNDAPVAVNDTQTVNEDTLASGSVAGNDSDIDNSNSQLAFAQIGSTSITEGVFVLNSDGTYSFTPALNFNGTVTDRKSVV